MKNTVWIGVALASGVALVSMSGCAATTETDDVPVTSLDTMEHRQLVTSTNADGTWTAYAGQPGRLGTGVGQRVVGTTTFTGPTGPTRRMGVCLLKREVTQPCNSVADCNYAPASLPTGGFRYCSSEDGSAQKYCYYRPGPPSTFCAGTPANGGVPIAAQHLITPQVLSGTEGTRWISYGCFEGCAATDPSSSSVARIANKFPPPGEP
jgi:hypothetical protein